jgi:geranylgeranyl diphosphate synthase type I
MSATAGLFDVGGVRSRVEKRITMFLSRKRLLYETDLQGTLLPPVAALLLGNGKRLRAGFCFWGWRGAGGGDTEAAIAAATALEMLHGCALIHDDVMDRSATRRGKPAVHRQFAETHGRYGWRGGADHFGLSAAILAGDLCLVWADEMLRHSGMSSQSLERAGPIFDAMREETIRGQYLDLVTQARDAAKVDDAWHVAQTKTAANTTTGPLAFGAALAGAGPELRAAYQAYAEPLGVAFQLRDDLLGAFGDPQLTGKPSGDDLRDGKCTVLLAQARQRGGPTIAAQIDKLISRGSAEAVDDLRAILQSTGARSRVERLITTLCAQSATALDAAPIDPEARRVLHGLAVDVAVDLGAPAQRTNI